IDPDYPKERINYMLKDSGAKILLSEGRHPDFPAPQLPSFPASLPSSLAYIIYTSGTTGKPKGVMVNHGNVVRLVKNSNFIEFSPKDRLLMTGALTFDITTFEIWAPLLNNVGLYLPDETVILDPEKFNETIQKNKITILHLIPQLFNQITRMSPGIFKDLRYFLVGGDLVKPEYVKQLITRCPHINREFKILHMYGPTENTTFSTFYPIDLHRLHDLRIPIGKPIANSTVYIIDKYFNLQPVGITGELIVGGEGVARGYLNQPEGTAEKFDHDLWDYQDYQDKKQKVPRSRFYRSYMSHSSYIYKTGDLGRWLTDGNIEFLGRIDHQVKIRGFRIELGEIEHQLLQYENINETLVVAKEENNSKYLCAYLVSKEKINVSGIRDFLSRKLPDYMVPAYFVQLDELPLTPSGKIDRISLPPPGQEPGKKYIPPRNAVEEKLAELWYEVLGRDALHASQIYASQSHASQPRSSIGIDDNFFELGGQSLKATLLISKIHKALEVKVPLAEVFKRQTIRNLSAYIEKTGKVKYARIEPLEKKEYYPLSSAQKRLFILQQIELEGTGYNMPTIMILEGDVDGAKLEKTFLQLIRRHESMRTSFKFIAEEPVQQVHLYRDIEFCIETSSIKNFIRPFDLSRAPLLRVGLEKLAGTEHIFMVDMHHIISDGLSEAILIREFMELYEGVGLTPLPPLRFQYKDYAQWQNKIGQTGKESLNKQKEYWLKEFNIQGEVPVLDLPTDYLRPSLQRFQGNTVGFEMGNQESKALKTLALKEKTTLYLVILSLYYILLSKLTSQEDIVVGTPAAGRRHLDLENIIGMFVNTLALRNYPSGEKSFSAFMKDVKEKTLDAFENQDYQFEDLVEQIAVNRDASRNPLFDVMFSLDNIYDRTDKPGDITVMGMKGIKLKPYSEVNKISKFDMTLSALEGRDKLNFNLEYSTKLFKQETIEKFINYFKKIVSAVLKNPAVKISAIEIISEEEKHRVLYDFNDTRAAYPKDKVIHQLFAEQVEQTPDHIAVIGMDHGPWTMEKHLEGTRGLAPLYITYRELNKKSGQLAHILIEKGVKPDTIVGIMIDRSPQAIIGILGILK
ncbi:MAG: AMP-binding protein, partial [Candidatus Aminicenantes bacterium]